MKLSLPNVGPLPYGPIIGAKYCVYWAQSEPRCFNSRRGCIHYRLSALQLDRVQNPSLIRALGLAGS